MIDTEVRALVDEAFDSATAILTHRRPDLDRGAKLLLEKETLTADEFPPLFPSEDVGTAERRS